MKDEPNKESALVDDPPKVTVIVAMDEHDPDDTALL